VACARGIAENREVTGQGLTVQQLVARETSRTTTVIRSPSSDLGGTGAQLPSGTKCPPPPPPVLPLRRIAGGSRMRPEIRPNDWQDQGRRDTMAAMPTPELPSNGVLRVRVADDLVLDAGTFRLAADHDQHPVAVIEPPETPMYRQVAAYLESKPTPPDSNPKRADEARAATAVCLRWGSYFALLADPASSPSPAIDDEQVSQIDDDEMARMNVEISAALAWWFGMCGANDRHYFDLVQRALTYLPLPPFLLVPVRTVTVPDRSPSPYFHGRR